MLLRSAPALLGLALPLAAQSLTWAEGPGPQDLTIRSIAEARPTAPPTDLLARVALLPIEVTNRTLQQGLRDDVARLAERRGVRRVALPGNGDLFAYARDGGRAFGFLWVRADGVPVVVLEEPGIGVAGLDTPFDDRIGVAPDGRHALVPRLDGAVHVLRLDGGAFASTGGAARLVAVPAAVDRLSLCVGAAHAWFATQDDRFWRIALGDGAAPVDLTPAGPAGSRLKPELAPSADGRAVAFLYGPQRQFSLYLAGDAGPAVRLPPPAAKYEEPGYLPATPDGPKLLLNDGATQLLYVDATSRDEVFVLDVSGVLPTTHWTGDPNFQPYIGVIILPVAIGSVFVAGIGDPGRFDVHAATAGVPGTVNLTLTSGAPNPPFVAGALVPHALATARDGTLLAALSPTGGGPTRVERFGAAGGVPVAADLRAPLRRGAAVGGSAADFLAPSHLGDVLLDGATGAPAIAVPPGVRLSTSVAGPTFRTLLAAAGPLRAVLFHFPGGGLFAVPGTGVDTVLRTPGGGIAFDGPAGLSLIDRSGVHPIPAGGAVRFVLAGAATTEG